MSELIHHTKPDAFIDEIGHKTPSLVFKYDGSNPVNGSRFTFVDREGDVHEYEPEVIGAKELTTHIVDVVSSRKIPLVEGRSYIGESGKVSQLFATPTPWNEGAYTEQIKHWTQIGKEAIERDQTVPVLIFQEPPQSYRLRLQEENIPYATTVSLETADRILFTHLNSVFPPSVEQVIAEFPTADVFRQER